jgi:hypothetical protein
MFGKFRREEATIYDEAIDKTLESLVTYGTEDAEFGDALSYLERLTKLKAERRRGKVSPDTIAMVVGNLAGILVVVAYEQKHVMTSKAMALLLRVK